MLPPTSVCRPAPIVPKIDRERTVSAAFGERPGARADRAIDPMAGGPTLDPTPASMSRSRRPHLAGRREPLRPGGSRPQRPRRLNRAARHGGARAIRLQRRRGPGGAPHSPSYQSATPVTAGCRMHKSDHEIALMRLAAQVTITAYGETAWRALKPGIDSAPTPAAYCSAAYGQLGFPAKPASTCPRRVLRPAPRLGQHADDS